MRKNNMRSNAIDCLFQLDGQEYAVPDGRHVLGRVVFAEDATAPAICGGVPEIGLHMASPGFDAFTEVWTTDAPPEAGEYQGLVYAHDGEYLFCAGSIPADGTYRE